MLSCVNLHATCGLLWEVKYTKHRAHVRCEAQGPRGGQSTNGENRGHQWSSEGQKLYKNQFLPGLDPAEQLTAFPQTLPVGEALLLCPKNPTINSSHWLCRKLSYKMTVTCWSGNFQQFLAVLLISATQSAKCIWGKQGSHCLAVWATQFINPAMTTRTLHMTVHNGK